MDFVLHLFGLMACKIIIGSATGVRSAEHRRQLIVMRQARVSERDGCLDEHGIQRLPGSDIARLRIELGETFCQKTLKK